MNSPSQLPRRAASGFSLVVSLIILTLLAILVVSFISTASLERTTAKAFVNKAGAEAAAETAVQQAISLLTEKITTYPDSATVWEPLTVQTDAADQLSSPATEGTMLYVNSNPNAITPQDTKRYMIPLMSRADANGKALLGGVEIVTNYKTKAAGDTKWTNSNSIDLNRPRYTGDTAGWIGKTGDNKRPVCRARWIDVKTEGTSTQAEKTFARYAFWVEDESFKVNLNQLGKTKRDLEVSVTPAGTSSPGALPKEVPIQGILKNARLGTDEAARTTLADNVLKTREEMFGQRLFDLRSFNQADATLNIGDEAKFYATVYSGGLNLSRHGAQRLNLNSLGFEVPLTAQTDTKTIDTQLGRIVETIKYHAPKFGQRFYRNSLTADRNAEPVTPTYQNIYLYKLAANIRDYIDPDLQPTLINSNFKVVALAKPATAINSEGGSALNGGIIAQGKDSGPFLQDNTVRYRTTFLNRQYTLRIDYYIEFWNMTDKPIYCKQLATPPLDAAGKTYPYSLASAAGTGDVFLRIANQQKWITSPGGETLPGSPSPNDFPSRDIELDLSNNVQMMSPSGGTAPIAAPNGIVVFEPGCTVITTASDFTTTPAGANTDDAGTSSPAFSGGYNPRRMYLCQVKPGGGVLNYSGTVATNVTGIKPYFRNGTGGGEDYETEIVLGNGLGVIDSHPCAIAMGGGAKVTGFDPATSQTTQNRDDWYGGTLFGNGTSPSQLGDPRTNNEQLSSTFFVVGSTAQPDQTRYWNSVSANRFSIGYPNDWYTNPQETNRWPDNYRGWNKPARVGLSGGYRINSTYTKAAAIVANGNLDSIGQLGDVFDPARVVGSGSFGIEGSRGGGRTLRIGQSDAYPKTGTSGLVDMSTVYKASQQWAAWRLVDFFSAVPKPATAGVFTEKTDPLYRVGLININGVRRDNGAALRAACYGMKIQARAWPYSATALTDQYKDLDTDERTTATAAAGLQNLITQAITRLSITAPDQPSYFRERGEISELDIFSQNTTANNAALLSGINMNDAFDRTREELVRRVIDLTTTRGSVFSVYAVGQSISVAKDANQTRHVTGEHWTKVTFALLPRKADGSDFRVAQETFIPSNSDQRTARFAKPDHYDIQLLQVSTP